MAVVQNPITGRTRKSFATATFTKNFNQNVMRSKPTQVANPKTIGQTSQRSAFKNCIDFSKQALEAIKLGFQYFGNEMSPYSYSLKENTKNAITGVQGSRVFDKTKFVTSKGSLLGLNFTQQQVEEDTGDVHIRWDAQVQGPDADPSDQVQVLIYHGTSGYFKFYKNNSSRADQQVQNIVVPTNVDMTKYYAILFLTPGSAIAKKRTSNSQNFILDA